MIETLQTIRLPSRIGGNLCLDFCNTAEHRGDEQFRDLLVSYSHWPAWCWRTEIVTEETAERLLEAADREPERAAAALGEVVTLRESLYAILSAVIDGVPEKADLTALNAALRRMPPEHVIWMGSVMEGEAPLRPYRTMPSQFTTPRMGQGFAALPDGADDDLSRPLWPVVLAAKGLLISEQVNQVRKCPNCGWLFVDTSRNGTRRWCSMDYCGSKVKSRRQYERRRLQNKAGKSGGC